MSEPTAPAGAPAVAVPAGGLPVPYRRHQFAVAAAVLAALAIAGVATRGSYGWGLLGSWSVLTISTLGFYLVFGLSGQFAFSQAAFMAIGAYTSVALDGHGGFLVGLVCAIVVAAAVAVVLGAVISRTQRFAFAIATLAIGYLVTVVFREWTAVGGEGGERLNIARPRIFGYTFSGDGRMLLLVGVALALALAVVVLVERSPLRREAVAVRDNPVVATLSGVSVGGRRVLLFALGSAFAGAAGALLAHRSSAIFPETFSLTLAIDLFLALLFGGMGSMWGPLLGALFVTQVPERLRFVGRYQDLVYGALLVVIIIAVPDGLVGAASRAARALRAQARRRGRAAGQARTLAPDGAAPAVPSQPPGLATPAASERAVTVAPTTEPVFAARDVDVHFGGVRALGGVSLAVRPGEIVGLVGPNGSGKSTFLNAVTGLVPAGGSVAIGGGPVPARRPSAARAAGLGRTFQTPQVIDGLTCLENVMLAVPDRRLTGLTGAVLRRRAMLRAERDRAARAREALAQVGLTSLTDTGADELAYGWRRRLELARVLVAHPRVLLLDEPAAGLNETETAWLAGLLRDLRDRGVGLLVVEHKLDLLNSVCDRLVVLRLGEVVAEGEPGAVWADPAVVEAYLGGAHRAAPVTPATGSTHAAG